MPFSQGFSQSLAREVGDRWDQVWKKNPRDVTYMDLLDEGLVNPDEWKLLMEAEQDGLPAYQAVYYWVQVCLFVDNTLMKMKFKASHRSSGCTVWIKFARAFSIILPTKREQMSMDMLHAQIKLSLNFQDKSRARVYKIEVGFTLRVLNIYKRLV